MIRRDLPNFLYFQGKLFNFAGPGRSSGGFAFLAPATGEVIEIFAAKIVALATTFATATVMGNAAVPPVRIDSAMIAASARLNLATEIFVAINFTPTGPRAKAIWPITPTTVSAPAITKLGTIDELSPNFGFIRPADGSGRVFFHCSQLRGVVPVRGLLIRFETGIGPRGPIAKNVQHV